MTLMRTDTASIVASTSKPQTLQYGNEGHAVTVGLQLIDDELTCGTVYTAIVVFRTYAEDDVSISTPVVATKTLNFGEYQKVSHYTHYEGVLCINMI